MRRKSQTPIKPAEPEPGDWGVGECVDAVGRRRREHWYDPRSGQPQVCQWCGRRDWSAMSVYCIVCRHRCPSGTEPLCFSSGGFALGVCSDRCRSQYKPADRPTPQEAAR